MEAAAIGQVIRLNYVGEEGLVYITSKLELFVLLSILRDYHNFFFEIKGIILRTIFSSLVVVVINLWVHVDWRMRFISIKSLNGN